MAQSVPPDLTKTLWSGPAAIWVTPVVMGTGVDFETVVPSPSCPSQFPPQHFTAPLVSNAHVYSPPPVIAGATLLLRQMLLPGPNPA